MEVEETKFIYQLDEWTEEGRRVKDGILRLLACMIGRRLMPSSVKDEFLMRVAGIMVRLTEELSYSNKPSTLVFRVTLSFSEIL